MKGLLKFLVIGLLSALAFAPFEANAKKVREVSDGEVKLARKCIVNWFDSQLSVREATNKNDGKEIDEYFAKIGMKGMSKQAPSSKFWCGAFVANAWLSCLEKIPWVKNNARLANVDGWRYDAKEYLVSRNEAGPGDIVALKSYRHVEGIKDIHPNPAFPFYTGTGGNTSASSTAKDKRQGVHEKNRLWRDVGQIISVRKALEGLPG